MAKSRSTRENAAEGAEGLDNLFPVRFFLSPRVLMRVLKAPSFLPAFNTIVITRSLASRFVAELARVCESLASPLAGLLAGDRSLYSSPCLIKYVRHQLSRQIVR